MEFLKKNAGLIIFVGILLIVVWYYFLRKKKAESSYKAIGSVGIGQECQCADGSVGPNCCPGMGGGTAKIRWPWQKKYVRNEYDVEKVSF
jgi:cbb3-type cytochrome oxidase subunit 3